uniref:Uncharacterized protein n=1 Tax=Arundo donax TaxID=35708 RepID=A0A0A9DYG6_ARUDO
MREVRALVQFPFQLEHTNRRSLTLGCGGIGTPRMQAYTFLTVNIHNCGKTKQVIYQSNFRETNIFYFHFICTLGDFNTQKPFN